MAYAGTGEVGVLSIPQLKTLWSWKAPGVVDWLDWAPDGRHLITHNGNQTVYVLRFDEKKLTEAGRR